MSAGYEPMAAPIGAGHSLIVADCRRRSARRGEFVRRSSAACACWCAGIAAPATRSSTISCRTCSAACSSACAPVRSTTPARCRLTCSRPSSTPPAPNTDAVVRRNPMSAIEQIADNETPGSRLDATQLAGFLRDLLAEMPVARDREILRALLPRRGGQGLGLPRSGDRSGPFPSRDVPRPRALPHARSNRPVSEAGVRQMRCLPTLLRARGIYFDPMELQVTPTTTPARMTRLAGTGLADALPRPPARQRGSDVVRGLRTGQAGVAGDDRRRYPFARCPGGRRDDATHGAVRR